MSSLRESLECPVCLNLLKIPKQLTCGHTYLELCINKLVEMSAASSWFYGRRINCPECRQYTTVTRDGLSTNFKVKDLATELKNMNIRGESSKHVDEHSAEMVIPGDKCGLIIGKKRETIKSLQKIAASNSLVEKIFVPTYLAKFIIGEGGKTKLMAARSGAKIYFESKENPNAVNRTMVIQGTRAQINDATGIIATMVSKHERVFMQTGAKVWVKSKEDANAINSTVVIEGTSVQINQARRMIYDILAQA